MEENLHIQWLRLRRPSSQRKVDHFSVTIRLNPARLIEIANGNILVDELTAKHAIPDLAFLPIPFHYDGRAQNLVHFRSPKML